MTYAGVNMRKLFVTSAAAIVGYHMPLNASVETGFIAPAKVAEIDEIHVTAQLKCYDP